MSPEPDVASVESVQLVDRSTNELDACCCAPDGVLTTFGTSIVWRADAQHDDGR